MVAHRRDSVNVELSRFGEATKLFLLERRSASSSRSEDRERLELDQPPNDSKNWPSSQTY